MSHSHSGAPARFELADSEAEPSLTESIDIVLPINGSQATSVVPNDSDDSNDHVPPCP